jgi:MFS family permease
MSAEDDEPLVRAPHTAVFLVLLAPFGLSSGYVSVTLAYVLAAHGLKTAAVSALIALAILPQTWKVIWAPVVDTTLSAKAWYLIGAVLVGLTILVMSVIPSPAAALPLLSLMVVLSSIASSLTSMSSETFMANLDPHLQGKASGWSQAGNFAGGSLGGGIGLWLATHVHAQWVSGAALCLFSIACALPLLLITESDRTHMRETLRETLGEVARDVWSVIRTRAGLLVIVLMLLPISSGGLPWNAVTGEWKVDADTVALTGGLLSGLIAIPGALAGGYLCDWMNRWTAYCLIGLLVAACLVVVNWVPRTAEAWIAGSLAYQALVSAGYAAYSAVVLEAIGRGAAATKFNFMASVSNVPVTAVPWLDGILHDRYGTPAMFYGEAVENVAAAILFALLVIATRRWRPRPAP